MKNHAQAILQFTGYPLEPIVALEIKKSYQLHLQIAWSNAAPHAAEAMQKGGFVYTATDVDERWFSSYE